MTNNVLEISCYLIDIHLLFHTFTYFFVYIFLHYKPLALINFMETKMDCLLPVISEGLDYFYSDASIIYVSQ